MRPPKMGGSPIISLGHRRGTPTVPVEIRDAVEQWARTCGRHADIVFVPHTRPPIPQVRIELLPHDPRLRAWQEGDADEKPVETVELVEWNDEKKCYVGMNLTDLGAGGVVELLERGNTWSGRGEFSSIQEGVVAARAKKKSHLERLQEWVRGEVIQRARDRAYGDRATVNMFTVERDLE